MLTPNFFTYGYQHTLCRYYVLNDDGSFALAKINAMLFEVLSKIYSKSSKKEAAKFYTLHIAHSNNKKYKFNGGREKFMTDMMRDFPNTTRNFIEKLWKEDMKE